jgi:putative DNA primase/helicase
MGNEGCLEWQQLGGLNPPASVRSETEEYFAIEDKIGRFIDECCEIEPGARCERKQLYTEWRAYCDKMGETAGTAALFYKLMEKDKRLRRYKTTNSDRKTERGFEGIRLRM